MRILILLACLAACDREAAREPMHPDVAVAVHSTVPTPRPELPPIDDVVDEEVVVVATTGDRDADGIPDEIDKCPDQPEDINGVQDIDGCPDPDPGDKLVEDVE